MNIVLDRTNALFGRREITFSAPVEASTPSKAEMKKALCSKLGLSPEATIIVRLEQGFGSKECRGLAHSYKHKEDLEKNEPKHLLKRLEKGSGKGSKEAEQPQVKKEEDGGPGKASHEEAAK